MRFGFVILGLFLGGIAGLIGAYAAIILMFDVFALLSHGGDHMGGFAALIFFAPVGALVGGVMGAIWLVRRARDGVLDLAIVSAGVFAIITGSVCAALLILG